MSIKSSISRDDNFPLEPKRLAGINNSSSVSLRCLFQILTACCVFFACLRISPAFTFLGTILIAPALIRTAWASDLYRLRSKSFGWQTRLSYFVGSLGVVLTTLGFGVLVFAVICLSFALLGMLFGVMISADMIVEAAIVGMAGGMIWGMAGALLAIAFAAIRIWSPQVD